MSLCTNIMTSNPLEIRLIDYEIGSIGSDKEFIVTAFGMTAEGVTCAIHIQHVRPTAYLKVCGPGDFTPMVSEAFNEELREELGSAANLIVGCETIEAGYLYGFDNGHQHKYIQYEFSSMQGLYALKNLFFTRSSPKARSATLQDYEWGDAKHGEWVFKICESTVPPLLRAFHRRNIKPAGWIQLPKVLPTRRRFPRTRCDLEHIVFIDDIVSLPDKEDPVPMIVCSFDIEADSSHGDFPLATKGYEKPASEIVELYDEYEFDDNTVLFDWIAQNLNDALCGTTDEISKIYTASEWTDTQYDQLESAIRKLGVKSRRPKIKSDDSDGDNGDPRKVILQKARTIPQIMEDPDLKPGEKAMLLADTLNTLVPGVLPTVLGDPITFIGSSFRIPGSSEISKTCICVGKSNPVLGSEIINVPDERSALLAWTRLIVERDPSIVIGYNTYGFDYKFMIARANVLGCAREFLMLSRFDQHVCGTPTKPRGNYSIAQQTLRIASGVHVLEYIAMPGRVNIDLYNHFRKEVNLDSYKLDDVAGHFIGDGVKKVSNSGALIIVDSKNLHGLVVGNYVVFEELRYAPETMIDGRKFKVSSITKGQFTIEARGIAASMIKSIKGYNIRWRLAKDDIGPQDIFRLTQTGIPDDLATVAKYCIADTTLVHHLLAKTDVLTGYTEMANICSVPMSFLVTRGQGIKLQSYLAKRCQESNIIMPDLDKRAGNEAYEGAIVLEPNCQLYQNEPVAVVDFSSLYPSCSIADNISHDAKVWTKQYDLSGKLVSSTVADDFEELPGHEYREITFDTYAWRRVNGSKKESRCKTGKRTCCWIQFPDGHKSVLPSVLKELLVARKATRSKAKHKTITKTDGTLMQPGLVKDLDTDYKLMAPGCEPLIIPKGDIASIVDTYDDFMKNVFDKRQLGYKITANSVYGQTGAKTSAFYEPDIAASITAQGRALLEGSREMIEKNYNEVIRTIDDKSYIVRAECVYGDTDSLFLKFNLRNANTMDKVIGREARAVSIALGKESGAMVTKTLDAPHDLEYEKTFDPFILLSAKRYAGMLYEEDPDGTPKLKSMGIVLKRRDNAAIVKDMYGGVLEILMANNSIGDAVMFVKESLEELTSGKIPMSRLIITKSLRSHYKCPAQIPHKVLASRIAQRDPGNAPRPGDRVKYVYIQNMSKTALQGDRIETPDYITATGKKIDYQHYVTNQIMKPLQQVFALVLEKIPGFQRHYAKKYLAECAVLQEKFILDVDTFTRREETLRQKVVKELIFAEALRKAGNASNGQPELSAFFKSA